MYKKLKDFRTGLDRTDAIYRIADCATIPNCNDNKDWIEYQAWLALGNTPEAAE